MVDAVGSKVLKLVRVAIGPVRIGDLEIGKWRPLREAEVRALMGPRVNAPSGSRLG
jgi:16S rRNA U516 pseudouridylate synthase RsuA-like enzyme